MNLDHSSIPQPSVPAVLGQRTLALAPKHSPFMCNQICPMAAKPTYKTAYSLIIAVPNILQNEAAVHSLSRNIPAMPTVASATMHKLSGFFYGRQFFSIKYFNKPADRIPAQLAVLKKRGVTAQDESKSHSFLGTVNFFRPMLTYAFSRNRKMPNTTSNPEMSSGMGCLPDRKNYPFWQALG